MSLCSRLVLPIIFSTLIILAGCGGNGVSIANPVAPPNGKFSNSNLSGTYVFSVSGFDVNGAPYALVGTLKANGSGGITGGTMDINNAEFTTPLPNLSFSSGSYAIGVDGRGRTTLNVSTPFGSNLIFDFVLQDSSHGLITEFDQYATGSGTLDLQSTGITPAGSYAFSISGNSYGGNPYGAVGKFTIGTGGSLTGLEDVNDRRRSCLSKRDTQRFADSGTVRYTIDDP